MKLRTLHITLTAAATVALSAGCSFLEEKSWDEVIPKTTNDFAELLIGSAYPRTDSDPLSVTSLMDDDLTLRDYASDYALTQSRELGSVYTWQPSVARTADNPFSTAFYHYYELIMGCNAVLDLIDDAVGLPADRDRYKAEALALRAYYYWVLVNLYGEPYSHDPDAPGVPLKLDSQIVREYPPRNTVAEVYDRIVDDLTEAIRLMEPLPVVRMDSRINRPAMHILFSRVLLHMEDWEGCAEQADKAMATGTVIFDMTRFGNVPLADNTTRYWLDYRTNHEIEWSFGALPTVAIASSRYYVADDALLGRIFDAANDTRYIHGFTVNTWGGGNTFIFKFITFPTNIPEPKQSFRASEALLNRAEALARMGELDLALEDYNTLRRNRILDYADETIGDRDMLIRAIRDERRREFFQEGFRWFDLRRYGMPAITHVFADQPNQPLYFTLAEEDPMYTLPLEAALLQRNENLEPNPSNGMGDRTGSSVEPQ